MQPPTAVVQLLHNDTKGIDRQNTVQWFLDLAYIGASMAAEQDEEEHWRRTMAAVRPNPSWRLVSRRTGTPVKHNTTAVVSSITMLQPGVTMQSHNDLHSMIISRFRHPESHGVEVAMGGLAGVV